MSSERLPDLYAEGRRLDTSPEAFGELHGSDDLRGDREALRQRLAEEGYLYLPGLLERDEVLAVRAEIFKRLDERGMLCPEHPVSEGVVREEAPPLLDYLDALTENNPLLDKLLYAGQMMRFYEFFLGGPVRHFDYTWIRAKVTGGLGTTAAH